MRDAIIELFYGIGGFSPLWGKQRRIRTDRISELISESSKLWGGRVGDLFLGLPLQQSEQPVEAFLTLILIYRCWQSSLVKENLFYIRERNPLARDFFLGLSRTESSALQHQMGLDGIRWDTIPCLLVTLPELGLVRKCFSGLISCFSV